MIRIPKKKAALPLLLSAALLTVSTTGCRVRQTQEGEMPDVDVEVKGGQVPKYDVDAPDVDVKMKDKQVQVPTDVDVKTEKRTVKVPEVDVKPPADGDQDPPRR
ncbi:MAG TPA: hypothetical protein VGG03_19040 [Thermoanaerobaculia bacterium]|jgi:hypothetical protein